MNKIAAFISGHGFGHASRSVNILRELLKNGCHILIVTNVPKWFFDDKIGHFSHQWSYTNHQVDVGLSQVSGLASDYHQTIKDLHNHWDNIDQRINAISEELNAFQADKVYFDIPAIAVLVAEKLQIPSIGMSNFSWDWIYDDLIHNECDYSQNGVAAEIRSEFIHFRDLHRKAYAKTSKLLKLPYSGDFPTFKCEQIDIPWIGNKSNADRESTLTKLNIDSKKKVALYSFGGHDLPAIDFDSWKLPVNWDVLIVGYDLKVDSPQVHIYKNSDITEKGVDYTDVVKAVDMVVTKPGYGIIADCICNQTPMLHVERGQFAEYPLLLQALDSTLPHKKIKFEEVTNATIFHTAEELIQSAVFPKVDSSGAKKAVSHIL